MIGNHHNIQAYIACTCLSKMNCDPEFYTIVQAIKAARHFLVHADREDNQLFLKMAVQTRVRASLALGPATAFHAYIAKLGWTLNQVGDLFISAECTLNLLSSNLENILQAVDDAWMRVVALSISNRRNMGTIPVPARQRTRKAVGKLPVSVQAMVAIDMTAGYMLNDQKKHFDADQELTCELCESVDTATHRVLYCPATEAVRAHHSQTISFLEEHDEIHTMLPLAYQDPEVEFCKIILNSLPWPEVFRPHMQGID